MNLPLEVHQHQSSTTQETVHIDRYRLGGNIVRVPVCFSQDEKTFFSCSGSVVKVFHVATGSLLGTLEGHTARVTTVLINPENPLQLLTTSHDGTIRKWDYIESTCLDIMEIGKPILQAVVHGNNLFYFSDQDHYIRINAPVGQNETICEFGRLDLRTKAVECISTHPIVRNMMAISSDGEYVALMLGTDLLVYSTSRKITISFSHPKKLTTLAFHPTEHIIATGDEKGVISLWINLDNAFVAQVTNESLEKKTQYSNQHILMTELHWHSSTVYGLVFSEDGSYLLSGADEAVLVFWQLATGHKQFLPRFGAPILHLSISPRGTMYAIACADNTIHMINAVNNKIMHQTQGLQLATADLFQIAASGFFHRNQSDEAPSREQGTLNAPSGMLTAPTGLVIHPITGTVAVSGKVGFVQIYDVYTDRHVANIAVVERNYVSKPTDHEARNKVTRSLLLRNQSNNNQISPFDDDVRSNESALTSATVLVEHMIYSPKGDWIVTVDRWLDGITAERTTLKFWYDIDSNPRQSQFVMNTRVENPHKGKITSVVYHPTENHVVTTSIDGTFKIWQLEDIATTVKGRTTADATTHKPTRIWSCCGSGDYRSMPVTSAAYSNDGSVLAVAYKQIITLWNPTPDNITLCTTLVHPTPDAKIRSLSFIRDTPYLVAASHSSLFVWNMITCSVVWSYQMVTAAVAVHPTLPYIAALVVVPSSDGKKKKTTDASKKSHKTMALLIFHAESPTPIRVIDASDARFDVTIGGSKDESNVYTSSLAFIPHVSANSNTTLMEDNEDLYAPPSNDATSIVYLNTSKEITRLPNALHRTASDTDSAKRLLPIAQDPERIAHLRSILNDKTSLFTQIYGKQTGTILSELSTQNNNTISSVNVTNYRDIHSALVAFLKTPAHVLGSLSIVYGNFMDAFLTKK